MMIHGEDILLAKQEIKMGVDQIRLCSKQKLANQGGKPAKLIIAIIVILTKDTSQSGAGQGWQQLIVSKPKHGCRCSLLSS